MNNELIKRYIYAVVKHLPLKLRADVEKELESLISDMLEERCGGVLPTEKDIRIVLTELGTPGELAAKYAGEENQALISGVYLLMYKRVLKIVLPIAAIGIAFAGILSLLADWPPQSNPYVLFGQMFGQVVGGAFSGAFQAFAVITIVFAILEWKKVKFNDGDALSHLPPVPKENERIKLHDPIIGIMWCIFAAILFLGFPQAAGAWLDGVGWIPIFDVAFLRSLWLPIVLWAGLGIAKEIVKLVEGRYTWRLAIVTIVADLLIMASTAVVFLNGSVLNPDFVAHINDLLVGEGGQSVTGIFTYFNLFFLGVVFFALIIEMITVAAKAWKYER